MLCSAGHLECHTRCDRTSIQFSTDYICRHRGETQVSAITFTVYGITQTVPRGAGSDTLLNYLHDSMWLTGTKLCCGIAVCRACTVQMRRPKSDTSEPVVACSTPLSLLDGADITTVEGVAAGDQLDPVQTTFLKHFAFQCGYCTPGFVMATRILLEQIVRRRPEPDSA